MLLHIEYQIIGVRKDYSMPWTYKIMHDFANMTNISHKDHWFNAVDSKAIERQCIQTYPVNMSQTIKEHQVWRWCFKCVNVPSNGNCVMIQTFVALESLQIIQIDIKLIFR